jgi:hypothetical protein
MCDLPDPQAAYLKRMGSFTDQHKIRKKDTVIEYE